MRHEEARSMRRILIGVVSLAVVGIAAAAVLLSGSAPAPRAGVSNATSATVPPGSMFACTVSPVRYTPAPQYGNAPMPPGLPWVSVAGARIVGALAYYLLPTFQGLEHAVIPTDAEAGNGAAPKILWAVRGRAVPGLDIRGRRLDAPGSFHQHIGPESGNVGTAFSSIIDVPRAGCWELHVRAGATSGSLTVQAVALVS